MAPLGTTANKMGRVAGANIAGGHDRFPGALGTAITRVFSLEVGPYGAFGRRGRPIRLRP